MGSLTSDQIGRAVDEVESILQQKFQASGDTLEQKISSSHKLLPRDLKKSAAVIADIGKRARHQPFLLETQKKSLEKARRRVTELSHLEETKAKRKVGRRQWLSGLVLNYTAFLVLLAGFWYVATKM